MRILQNSPFWLMLFGGCLVAIGYFNLFGFSFNNLGVIGYFIFLLGAFFTMVNAIYKLLKHLQKNN